MSKPVTQPARFKDVIRRATYDLRRVRWTLEDIESAASEGDERCTKFREQYSYEISAILQSEREWAASANHISNQVEHESAVREKKTHCDVCGKYVKNMASHARNSISHKGRARVKELDADPNWCRTGRYETSTDKIITALLATGPPSGAEAGYQHNWSHEQKQEYSDLKRIRKDAVSDVVIQENYSYHANGKPLTWGDNSGQNWTRPHIKDHSGYLYSIMDDIRVDNGITKHWERNLKVDLAFQKIVDPFIRNPNDVIRRAAMYSLQLDNKEN